MKSVVDYRIQMGISALGPILRFIDVHTGKVCPQM